MQQFSDCCPVKNSGIYDQLTILDDSEAATRNANYKLFRKTAPNCSTTTPSEDTFTEFYSINEKPVTPRIDYRNLAYARTM